MKNNGRVPALCYDNVVYNDARWGYIKTLNDDCNYYKCINITISTMYVQEIDHLDQSYGEDSVI